MNRSRLTDRVDEIRAQWARELPDLDTTPTAVLGRVYRLARLLAPTIEATMAEFGLDRGEFDVLATLRRHGAPYRMTPTALYQQLLISSGSLTHRLKRLEAAGLVERVKSESDGRSLEVHLNARGRSLIERTIRADMKAERRLLDAIDPATQKTLADALRRATLQIEALLAQAGSAEPDPQGKDSQ
jgi:DNA-binding MarR family transcriptional regulator